MAHILPTPLGITLPQYKLDTRVLCHRIILIRVPERFAADQKIAGTPSRNQGSGQAAILSNLAKEQLPDL